MKKCLLLVGLSMAACSPSPTETEPAPSVAPSVSRERRDELKTVFGKAFATALADSPSLRKLIKDEALLKFNNDYDVLYHLIKDHTLADGQSVRELLRGYFADPEQLSVIEREVPLLTIFVPQLPHDSFSAETWDTAAQIPAVGITSYKTNDVLLVDPHGEEHIIEASLVPGFPVVVIKENERVVLAGGNTPSANPSAMAKQGRVLKASGTPGFAFLSESFDGSRATDKSAARTIWSPDQKLLDAYDIYLGTDGWHRDLIYYNISPNQTRGAFSYAFQEHVTSFQMLGDPAIAFAKIADQTGDPTMASLTENQSSGWTGGSFEFKVRALINAKNGIGQELVTYFPAAPSELFMMTYDPVKVSWFTFYKPRLTGTIGKNLSLPLFAWDLNDYASTIKIEVEEVDLTETTVLTESRSMKFATNFGIDPTVGFLQKIGLKFGASLEETRTETTQRTFTEGNDVLGSVIVNFADNVLTNVTIQMAAGMPWKIGTTREYATGWYTISVVPTRVQ
ncbi:hypothetical protein HPC49_42005 [Pyxidicoccus fallax]|uniref:Lipoprotein n=1 Tax=Pyxidicoccus fallax TaxID=394095 RepID=A0A848LXX1_9BACT|nr:hypothetical protein [Pyxidicoccus fallax]NMO22666.1 hypothetical protein [Pyxidicoccus fallax]NPC84779.1 hypothetical protein [Pyxidicoccus fallax]